MASILLVDDDPMVRRSIRRLLESEGYQVLEASCADEARTLLAGTSAIDLIILDQTMPGESGVVAVPSLRELRPSPIILFSGMARERPPGVAAVLEKPARPGELFDLIRRVLAEA